MGYSVKMRNTSEEYEGIDRSTSAILEDHWERYRDLEGKGVHKLRPVYDLMSDNDEPYRELDELYEEMDIDESERYDPDELADVDEDWEEMLERHAAAEGYEL